MMRSFDPDLKTAATRQVSSPSSLYRERARQSASQWSTMAVSRESLESLSQPMLRHSDSDGSGSDNGWKQSAATGWRQDAGT